MSCKSESKYFSYLSGLTVKELRDIARESGLYGYTALRKASLIRFLRLYSKSSLTLELHSSEVHSRGFEV